MLGETGPASLYVTLLCSGGILFNASKRYLALKPIVTGVSCIVVSISIVSSTSPSTDFVLIFN